LAFSAVAVALNYTVVPTWANDALDTASTRTVNKVFFIPLPGIIEHNMAMRTVRTLVLLQRAGPTFVHGTFSQFGVSYI